MQIVREVMADLDRMGIQGVVSDVAATGSRRLWTPWTMATVTFPDGLHGRGVACNRYSMPADPKLVRDYMGKDVYGVLEALLAGPQDDFDSSLAFALLSAMSAWLWPKPGLFKKLGLVRTDLLETPWDPAAFITPEDTVVFCGYASWDVPAVRNIARRVVVLEDQPAMDFAVFDPQREPLKVEFAPRSQAPEMLAEADVVFLSGEVLLDDRLDLCLEKSGKARTRILHGPTSSFYPLAFFNRGVHVQLAVSFPGDATFRSEFLENRGYWYAQPGIRGYLVGLPMPELDNLSA